MHGCRHGFVHGCRHGLVHGCKHGFVQGVGVDYSFLLRNSSNKNSLPVANWAQVCSSAARKARNMPHNKRARRAREQRGQSRVQNSCKTEAGGNNNSSRNSNNSSKGAQGAQGGAQPYRKVSRKALRKLFFLYRILYYYYFYCSIVHSI